jgi:hypothetical protein
MGKQLYALVISTLGVGGPKGISYLRPVLIPLYLYILLEVWENTIIFAVGNQILTNSPGLANLFDGTCPNYV